MSDSLIGSDVRELDRLMIQARTNNALAGTTGLLWTDGARFAQVLEGDAGNLNALLTQLRADPRHHDLRVVEENSIAERQYGDWSMLRPATDELAPLYEQRMIDHLDCLTDSLSRTFRQIIAGSHPGAASS